MPASRRKFSVEAAEVTTAYCSSAPGTSGRACITAPVMRSRAEGI